MSASCKLTFQLSAFAKPQDAAHNGSAKYRGRQRRSKRCIERRKGVIENLSKLTIVMITHCDVAYCIQDTTS